MGASADTGPDCLAEHVVASCEQSLCRLQVDHIDLYQVHFDDLDTPAEETIEALERLKSASKIGRDHTFEEGDIRQVDPLFRSERLASALRLVERLRALGHEYDKTPVQVAVA